MQENRLSRKNVVTWIFVCLIAVIMISVLKTTIHTISISDAHEKVVVIDAGHGGDDPGKVGINGALEKDINLKIALLVEKYLMQNDVRVVLTRNQDLGLYEQSSPNKKIEDLKNRMAIIESSGATLAVSIHQNSYTTENVHGAQVFYYETSEQGRHAARIMQKRLIEGVDCENHREEKKNKSYYLLKKSSIPMIIVECGFLSNAQEADRLTQDEYQQKIAWNIAMGILQYLSSVR